jgi:hypothetical protein
MADSWSLRVMLFVVLLERAAAPLRCSGRKRPCAPARLALDNLWFRSHGLSRRPEVVPEPAGRRGFPLAFRGHGLSGRPSGPAVTPDSGDRREGRFPPDPMSGGAAWRLPEAADAQSTFLSHALAMAALHGPGPWPDGGYPLPDEDPARQQIMVGSVLDGIRTHHFGSDPNTDAAARIADLVADLVTGPPSVRACAGLHAALADQSALRLADALGEQLRRRDLPAHRVRAVGRWLAEYGTRRDVVAAGIVLLGLTGDERDRDLLLLLGTLEDLTLYAGVALVRTQPDPDRAVFELARRVAAWGRIQAVERLKGTSDPQIRGWLLREGFRNEVMDEYLAHLAATTGDLYTALLDPEPDEALLDGAGGIIDALCAVGSPAKDIRDYGDGPAVISRYLALVRRRAPSLARARTVLRLGHFLGSDYAAGLDRGSGSRQELRDTCRVLARRPPWRMVAEDALASPDLPTFRLALWPAAWLGIPIREHVRTRLRTDRFDGYLWQSLLGGCPEAEIGDLITLAQELLPLADLATGPDDSLGLSRSYAPDHALDLIVSRLGAYPGHGWILIKTALRNQVIRCRNMAIRTLTQWSVHSIPADAVSAVRDALQTEPEPKTRDAMEQLLETWNA